MSDFVVVESESRAAGSRGARAAAQAPSGRLGGRRRGTEEAERRTKAFCHRAAVNGVEGGVPEEGDRVAFEWKMDEGELFHINAQPRAPKSHSDSQTCNTGSQLFHECLARYGGRTVS